jgi:ribosomal protein bL25 (Ctc-form)
MSDQVTLTVDLRDMMGKQVKQLRKEGVVPGVIHDHGKDSVHVQAEYQSLYKAYIAAGKHQPVEVTAGDKKYTTIIKSVTFDPKYHALTHVVFGALKANEKVGATIPVHALYNEGNDSSPAERAGFIVLTQLDSVQVKALSKDLPDELTYDAEKLVNVGDQVTIGDLNKLEGVVVELEENHVIATVFEPGALAAANDEAGGTSSSGDEDSVAADHVGENKDVDPNRKDEKRPGGKEEKEDKQQGRNPEKS